MKYGMMIVTMKLVVVVWITLETRGFSYQKISSAFAGFTADQWKNWTIIYSLYALRDILAPPHYHCWESFVIACRLVFYSDFCR